MGNNAIIIDGKKKCRFCKEFKDLSLFGTFQDKKKNWVSPRRYYNSRCKKCATEASQRWASSNREIIRDKWIKKKEGFLAEIRKAYGGQCACCGEKEPIFLTLDHINNDGYLERPRNGGTGYRKNEFLGHKYLRIIREGFPKDLQLLCWNCKCGRFRNKGICPHNK